MSDKDVLDLLNAYDHITGDYRIRDQSINASSGLALDRTSHRWSPINESEGPGRFRN